MTYYGEYIKEFGKLLSKENPKVFLKLDTIKNIVCELRNISKEELESSLKKEKSVFYDKYNVLGFLNGKVVYRSNISSETTKIIKNIITKIGIDSKIEAEFVFDLLDKKLNEKSDLKIV